MPYHDPKPRPNHRKTIEALRNMTPAQRLKKCFELSDLTKRLLKRAIAKANPNATEEQVQAMYLRQLEKCHNRSF